MALRGTAAITAIIPMSIAVLGGGSPIPVPHPNPLQCHLCPAMGREGFGWGRWCCFWDGGGGGKEGEKEGGRKGGTFGMALI